MGSELERIGTVKTKKKKKTNVSFSKMPFFLDGVQHFFEFLAHVQEIANGALSLRSLQLVETERGTVPNYDCYPYN